jgi:hypothetical protein
MTFYEERRGVTFHDICVEIAKADFLRKKDSTAPTALEIYSYSPTGELYMILEWYEIALQIQRMHDELRSTLKAMMQPCGDAATSEVLRIFDGDRNG